MACFTSTPKSKSGEKVALLNFDEIEDDVSSGYDSPAFVHDIDNERKEDKTIETEYIVCEESELSSDEGCFESDDDSDDLDYLEEQEFAPDDTMKVTNMQPLIDNIRYILSMPDMCDVVFLVGPQRIPTFGLKSILGTRSNVFFSMFLKKSRDEMNSKKKSKKNKTVCFDNKTTIIIDSYDVDVFQSFLLFIHCGSVVMDATTVVGLLCCAAEFDIPELRTACWEFIDRCLTPCTVTVVLKETLRYEDHVVARKVRDAVSDRKTQITSKKKACVRVGPVGQETVV